MRQNAAVVNRLAATRPDECAISTITSYELYTGVEKCSNPAKEREKVECFLGAIHELAFERAAALESSRIRAFLESSPAMRCLSASLL
jgi:predicted nucleic acid-binding protein